MADVPKHLQRGPVWVGFYDIEGTLGKGNFAVVKLGRHRITKTEVRPGLAGASEARLGRGAVTRGGAVAGVRGGPTGRVLADARGPGTEDPGGAGGPCAPVGSGPGPDPSVVRLAARPAQALAPWRLHRISPRASHPGCDMVCGLHFAAQVPCLLCCRWGRGRGEVSVPLGCAARDVASREERTACIRPPTRGMARPREEGSPGREPGRPLSVSLLPCTR